MGGGEGGRQAACQFPRCTKPSSYTKQVCSEAYQLMSQAGKACMDSVGSQHSCPEAAQAALPAAAGLPGLEGCCSCQGPAAGALLAAVAGPLPPAASTAWLETCPGWSILGSLNSLE